MTTGTMTTTAEGLSTFLTYEEALDINPNLDQASYGLNVFNQAMNNNPEMARFRRRLERQIAQPLHQLQILKTAFMPITRGRLTELMHHPSPNVRKKAIEATSAYIRELQECLGMTGDMKGGDQ